VSHTCRTTVAASTARRRSRATRESSFTGASSLDEGRARRIRTGNVPARPNLANENVEPKEKAEPIENADAKEPTENAEPMEPMLKALFREPMEQNELTEPTDQAERRDPCECHEEESSLTPSSIAGDVAAGSDSCACARRTPTAIPTAARRATMMKKGR